MIRFKDISCVLITKDPVYPPEIVDRLLKFPFGEFIILTNSDSPYRKHELFQKAKYDLIYYQDDDAICPVMELVEASRPDIINVVMKDSHFTTHLTNRSTMGLGWGAIFPKKLLSSLKLYTDKYGEDDVFKRETERILTYLNFPQNRLILPVVDLPSAYAEDRLWRQPIHVEYKEIAQDRCQKIVESI